MILLLVKTDAVEQRLGLLDGVGLADLENVDGRLDDILQHRHVLPQVEALEHHSGPAADALDLAMVDRRQVAVAAGLQLHLLARDEDAPCDGSSSRLTQRRSVLCPSRRRR